MYALFKVANGEDITKAPAPGMFDLKVSSPTSTFISPSLTSRSGQGKAKGLAERGRCENQWIRCRSALREVGK
jgi:hypothetical protein